jgi:hypothetical protein|tara:strand:+ start:1263 stop:1658 length:396 start_codon:yes stop_codon:yes gene_type:complete
MNSYHEDILKKILKTDINLYFKDYEGCKVGLGELIDEFISHGVNFEEEEKEYRENKTHKFRDRIKYESKENKCLSRVWNCGMGGQCSFTGKYNGFCKKHSEKGYDWWLGTIDTMRPERPVNHKDKVHIWLN